MNNSTSGKFAGKFNIWAVLLLLAWIALILAGLYIQNVDLPYLEARRQLQQQILQGAAEKPYQQRLLVPYLTAALETALRSLARVDAFFWSYAIFDFAAIFLTLLALFFYLRGFFSGQAAVLGSLVASLSMLVGFRDHYFQPWSLLEPAIISLGLWAIIHNKHYLLAGLVFLGTLNRETGLFLVVAYIFSWAPLPGLQREAGAGRKLWSAALLLIWSLVFFGTGLAFSDSPRTISIQEIFQHNIQSGSLLQAARQILLFLGPVWIFGFLGYRHAPAFLKRMSWLAPAYLLVFMLFSIWYEVRLLMSLYPVLIPTALAYFYPANVD